MSLHQCSVFAKKYFDGCFVASKRVHELNSDIEKTLIVIGLAKLEFKLDGFTINIGLLGHNAAIILIFSLNGRDCAFRGIRPPIPTASGHLNRSIRPPVARCVEA